MKPAANNALNVGRSEPSQPGQAPAPLALTMGDPAGVGLEITATAWSALRGDARPGAVFCLIAPPARLEGLPAPIQLVEDIGEARDVFPHALPVLPLDSATPQRCTPGAPSAAFAPEIIASIETGVALAADGRAGGVVTNPIAKHILYEAGFTHPGHTEFIAELTAHLPWPPEDADGRHQSSARGPVMMLANAALRAVLVTIHAPLRAAADLITPERVERVVRVTHHALRTDYGLARPRIALCGLNPHAGENGAMGMEECEVLNPLAERLRTEGIALTDARPADTLFTEDARQSYDAVVAMYHDQGLIPVKTLDFHGAVNVTLGLAIVRASPDHGTGFAIAGQGVARADSLIAALTHADAVAARRAALRAALRPTMAHSHPSPAGPTST